MVVKMRLCGVLIAAIMLSAITSVNSIELYKMNLHKAIANNLKDAIDDKDDDEDALVRKLKAAKDARISAENDKRTV